ncbi:MAG: VWA domain-containing protein [Armatimonadetes bacterium]|nr:VWA domain-containing protein [Armatimonadota bacterium]
MSFADPWVLLLLLLLPVLGWRLARPGKAGSAVVAYPDLRLTAVRRRSVRPWLARQLPWVRLPALALLIVACARPQAPAGVREIGGAGIDIMLVLDISGSMQAEDFKPKNRFTVAREVLREFVSKAGANRLGLVVFSAKAFTQCPLAADHQIVSQLLERVQMGMLKEDGTAIGMAIATAAHRLAASQARSKVIILLTDGVNNRGEVDPPTAAEAAAALGVKIYTIGVGKEGGAPVPVPGSAFGPRYLTDPRSGRVLMTKLDEPMLKKIAQVTGGKYFRATDAEALRQIYDQIDKMEKSEFTAKRERRFTELFGRYARWGLGLLLLQAVLGATWLRKAP